MPIVGVSTIRPDFTIRRSDFRGGRKGGRPPKMTASKIRMAMAPGQWIWPFAAA